MSKDDIRPLGPFVPSSEPLKPERKPLRGEHVSLDPLTLDHAAALFPLVSGQDSKAHLWDYMSTGPFNPEDQVAFEALVSSQSQSKDPLFWAIVDPASKTAIGWATLMRIDTPNRVVEIGNLLYTHLLQRTVGSTEVFYLLASYVFEELHYRRLEWKCNNLNAPSKRAAERLGFVFEGVFRNHMIVKGRNRDTAWFAIVDADWPACRVALEEWLAKDNFEDAGGQKTRLEEFRGEKIG